MELDEPVRSESIPVNEESSQQIEASTSQPKRRLTRRTASKPAVDGVIAQEPSTSVAENKRKEPDSGLEEDSAPKKKVNVLAYFTPYAMDYQIETF